MAEPQTDGIMQMLDPFGFWKTYREAAIDNLSKSMIDMVQSDDYARYTGTFLDQYLSMTQPVQDLVQKNMAYSLAYLNMPTREEIVTMAERLVHIETRLDDLDDQTYQMHDDDQARLHKVEQSLDKAFDSVVARLDGMHKEDQTKLHNVEQSLDKVLAMHKEDQARLHKVEQSLGKVPSEQSLEKVLNNIMARLDRLEAKLTAATPKATASMPATKPEPTPEPKTEPKK